MLGRGGFRRLAAEGRHEVPHPDRGGVRCSVGLEEGPDLPLAALDLSAGYIAGCDPTIGESLPHCLTAGRDSDPGIYVGQMTLYGCF